MTQTSPDKKLKLKRITKKEKSINLLGHRFGRLIVIEDAGYINNRKLWKCECDCGRFVKVKAKYLLNSDTRSCGCLKKDGKLNPNANYVGDIGLEYWNLIITGAKKRKIKFDITREYAWELFLKQNRLCNLSGLPLVFQKINNHRSSPNRGRTTRTASLDRIDSSKGYIEGNVQWVHKKVNLAKHILSNDEFIELCISIADEQSRCTKKIICVSGGMDIPHSGHIAMINEAAKYGKVIVILNSDDWLIRKKGYVVMPWKERANLLKNLKNVVDVVPVNDLDGTVCEALQRIRPDYFANGGDRKTDNTPEIKLCNDLGIKLLFNIGGEKTQSSSWMFQNTLDMIGENKDV
jgi:D-beta-D-heptose 7-phosphate kinase/D-beta-D-heptose 1-phosphate adenosyltransferase